MSKLSVVIPTYTLDKELEEMALAAVKSYRYGADELIVCEDGGQVLACTRACTPLLQWEPK